MGIPNIANDTSTLEQRVAIVTGAGTGIGRAICERLSSCGIKLVLGGRREDALRETAARLARSDDAEVVPGDISDGRTADALVRGALRRWCRLDIVVNNAGMGVRRRIDQTDGALLTQVFSSNVFGPAMLIARAWPEFERQRGGIVINISSLASRDPFAGFFVYAASKAALESLARSVAKEGSPHGIHAYNIAPGVVETAMLRSIFSEQALSPQNTLRPSVVASVVLDCINGDHLPGNGQTIEIANP